MGYQGKLKKIISATLESVSTSGFSSDITMLTLVGNRCFSKQLIDQSTGSAKDSIKNTKR